jgi:hypothetical protein
MTAYMYICFISNITIVHVIVIVQLLQTLSSQILVLLLISVCKYNYLLHTTIMIAVLLIYTLHAGTNSNRQQYITTQYFSDRGSHSQSSKKISEIVFSAVKIYIHHNILQLLQFHKVTPQTTD